MQLDLRTRRHGGWWRNGLGDDACPFIDDTGMCTEFDPNAYVQTPDSTDPNAAAYQTMLAEQAAYNAAHGILPETGTAVPLPTAAAIVADIAKFAQIGVAALAPSAITGACPVGYVRSGAACIPGASPVVAPKPLIAGLSNNTLLMIGGGFLLLLMVSGGKSR